MQTLLKERMILRKKIRKAFVYCCVLASIITSGIVIEHKTLPREDTLIQTESHSNVQKLRTVYSTNISPIDMTVPLNDYYLEEEYYKEEIEVEQEETVQQYKEYIVEPNDTLWKIADSAYGSGALWETIFRYNELSSDIIIVGQVLKIPNSTMDNLDAVDDINEPLEIESDNNYYEPEKINRNSDLAVFNPISVEQMNDIISGYQSDSPFQGRGDVFIKASEETGLNPLYIFGHASLESGYGTSKIARTKHNYFGIGAYDADTTKAYAFGDSMEKGIVDGAKWIREHYYDKGYVSLYDMIYTAPYAYASAGDKWINDIVWIANANINPN